MMRARPPGLSPWDDPGPTPQWSLLSAASSPALCQSPSRLPPACGTSEKQVCNDTRQELCWERQQCRRRGGHRDGSYTGRQGRERNEATRVRLQRDSNTGVAGPRGAVALVSQLCTLAAGPSCDTRSAFDSGASGMRVDSFCTVLSSGTYRTFRSGFGKRKG